MPVVKVTRFNLSNYNSGTAAIAALGSGTAGTGWIFGTIGQEMIVYKVN
jgi:hypothetical protein